MLNLYDIVRTKECDYIKPTGSIGYIIGPVIEGILSPTVTDDGKELYKILFVRTIRCAPERLPKQWHLCPPKTTVYVNINDLEPALSIFATKASRI